MADKRTFRVDRSHGVRPGYRSVLPRVFPFKKELSKEDAFRLIRSLEEIEEVGFAVSEHPYAFDGHVTLWLSESCTRILTGLRELDSVDETFIGGRD